MTNAGEEVVIEELLTGPELSVLAFSDGYTVLPLPAAQDHKRIGEGDTGLNTGGMGAYAPAPVATPAIMERIMKESLQPTIDGMRREGTVACCWHDQTSIDVYAQDILSSASFSPDSCSRSRGPKFLSTTYALETQKPKL